MKDNKKSRRYFLKNTALASLSLGILPNISKAERLEDIEEESLIICDQTTLDYYGQGPFYTNNPPEIEDNQLASSDETGTPLIISGRVYNLECTQAIPNAIIDIWHANAAGQYDNQGYNLRGKTTSNEQGFYMFQSILPGKYLNGNKFRPAHIHFKITAPGFDTLTTQLYFEGDTDIPEDAAASITNGNFDATHRIIPLSTNTEGQMEGNWDIVINAEGVNSVNDIHLDKGIIYKVSPNPFSDQISIQYGVFSHSKVSLIVFNMHGQEVAVLQEQKLIPEKYEAVWQPDDSLPSGHYFIALKINDLQVYYLKIIRQKKG